MSTIENIVKSLAYATEHNQGLHLTHEEVPALNARIAELKAERRWIPVSERLPEGSGHYIVFDDHGDIMSCEFLADYKGEPLWDDDDGVLYWMPLPEPPEVEKWNARWKDE